MGAPPARAFPRAVAAAAARRYRVLFTLAFLSFLRVVVRGRARGDGGYLEATELTAELPVSDLSPWSNQIRMTVMLSQEFLPYLQQGER